MLCEEFFEGYSEYLDGRVGGEARASFDAHREACQTCRRYDQVVRRGLHVWRNLPEIDPSPDFVARLQHRLYHVDDESRLSQNRHVGSAALVAVASVGLLALAWLPFATRMAVEVELPAVAVEAPATVSATSGGGSTALGIRSYPVRKDATDRGSGSLFSSGPFIAPAAGPFYWTASTERAPGGLELPGFGWTEPTAAGRSSSAPGTPRNR